MSWPTVPEVCEMLRSVDQKYGFPLRIEYGDVCDKYIFVRTDGIRLENGEMVLTLSLVHADDIEHDEEEEHEHIWGPVEYSRFTGNPHRRCQVAGCGEATMDLTDEDNDHE